MAKKTAKKTAKNYSGSSTSKKAQKIVHLLSEQSSPLVVVWEYFDLLLRPLIHSFHSISSSMIKEKVMVQVGSALILEDVFPKKRPRMKSSVQL